MGNSSSSPSEVSATAGPKSRSDPGSAQPGSWTKSGVSPYCFLPLPLSTYLNWCFLSALCLPAFLRGGEWWWFWPPWLTRALSKGLRLSLICVSAPTSPTYVRCPHCCPHPHPGRRCPGRYLLRECPFSVLFLAFSPRPSLAKCTGSEYFLTWQYRSLLVAGSFSSSLTTALKHTWWSMS